MLILSPFVAKEYLIIPYKNENGNQKDWQNLTANALYPSVKVLLWESLQTEETFKLWFLIPADFSKY